MATRHTEAGIAHLTVVPENFEPDERREPADSDEGEEAATPWSGETGQDAGER